MRTDRNPHVLQDAVGLLDRGMIDGNAGIVDGLVHDAGRVGLRRPSEIVDGLRPVAFAGGIDLVDRDHLARLGFGEQVVVVKAPPGGRVAAKGLAGILRIGAGPRRDVDDAQLDHVALLGAADVDRAGADMHAEALAGAAPEQRRIHRSGAAPVHVLLFLGPQEHAFGAGIALHHALGIVIGVMGQGLDGDEVAGIDLDLRLQLLGEIAPMHGLGIGGQMVIGPLGRLVLLGGRRHLRRHQRNAARRHGRRAPGRREARPQERAAFAIERLLEVAVVQFEIRTVPVVTRAHVALLA